MLKNISDSSAVEARAGTHLPTTVHHQPGGAVVIGGAQGGLGVVRSLGRRGIPIALLTADHWLAASSRYVRRILPSPDLEKHSEAADYLLNLGLRNGIEGWVVFPCTDSAVEMISRHHESLARVFRLTIPPWNVLRWAHDKRLTYQRAAQLGIDFPETYSIGSAEEVAALNCRYPVILKPAFKEGRNPLTLDKAWKADNRNALLGRYAQACSLMNSSLIIVQEFIPGAGDVQNSYAALWHEGQPLVSLIAKRLRQYPIHFGHTSTYVQTVEEPEVEEISARFLRAIRYTGVVEMEFKLDVRDGRYKLLDINPRLWAWHTLSKRAGIDFPYLMWLLACGVQSPIMRARAGFGWVHVSKDLLAAIQEVCHRRLSPIVYLRSVLRPLEFAIAAADDPVPLFFDLPLLVRGALKRTIEHGRHN